MEEDEIEILVLKLEGLMRYIDTKIYISMGITLAMIILVIWFAWWISKRWISHDWLKLILMIGLPIFTFYISLILLIGPILKDNGDNDNCGENPNEIKNVYCLSLDDIVENKDDERFEKYGNLVKRLIAINTTPGLLSTVPRHLSILTILCCVFAPLLVFFYNKRHLVA